MTYHVNPLGSLRTAINKALSKDNAKRRHHINGWHKGHTRKIKPEAYKEAVYWGRKIRDETSIEVRRKRMIVVDAKERAGFKATRAKVSLPKLNLPEYKEDE